MSHAQTVLLSPATKRYKKNRRNGVLGPLPFSAWGSTKRNHGIWPLQTSNASFEWILRMPLGWSAHGFRWISVPFWLWTFKIFKDSRNLKESQGPIITYNNYKDLPQVKASPNQCDPNEIPSVYSVRPSATATWILPSCTWGRGDSCGTQRL